MRSFVYPLSVLTNILQYIEYTYMCIYWVLYVVVSILSSILVSIMLANIDNSTWFFIFMNLSTNGSWDCKLPFFVHGDDVRSWLLSLAICLCLRLYFLACVLVFKSRKTMSLLSSVTVSSNSLRWHTFKWLHLELFVQNSNRVLRVRNVEIFFFITGLRCAERAASSLCGEQSGVKKCWRVMA
jgi:hypothetical protein